MENIYTILKLVTELLGKPGGSVILLLAFIGILSKYVYCILTKYHELNRNKQIEKKELVIRAAMIVINIFLSIGWLFALLSVLFAPIVEPNLMQTCGIFITHFMVSACLLVALGYIISRFRVLTVREVTDAFNDVTWFSENPEEVSKLAKIMTIKLTSEYVLSKRDLAKLLNPALLCELNNIYQDLLGRDIDPWAVVTHGIEFYLDGINSRTKKRIVGTIKNSTEYFDSSN